METEGVQRVTVHSGCKYRRIRYQAGRTFGKIEDGIRSGELSRHERWLESWLDMEHSGKRTDGSQLNSTGRDCWNRQGRNRETEVLMTQPCLPTIPYLPYLSYTVYLPVNTVRHVDQSWSDKRRDKVPREKVRGKSEGQEGRECECGKWFPSPSLFLLYSSSTRYLGWVFGVFRLFWLRWERGRVIHQGDNRTPLVSGRTNSLPLPLHPLLV